MNSRTVKLGAIGAAVGILVAGAALTPASAAKPVRSASVTSECSQFDGKTVQGGAQITFSDVGLKAGEKITVNVDPVGPNDVIWMPAFISFGGTSSEPRSASAGWTYTAPANGSYSLTWQVWDESDYSSPDSLTWSFTASCDSADTTTTTKTKGGGKARGKR